MISTLPQNKQNYDFGSVIMITLFVDHVSQTIILHFHLKLPRMISSPGRSTQDPRGGRVGVMIYWALLGGFLLLSCHPHTWLHLFFLRNNGTDKKTPPGAEVLP